jgi:hypothetical protein
MVLKYKNKKFKNYSLMILEERNYKITINYQVNNKYKMEIKIVYSNKIKI